MTPFCRTKLTPFREQIDALKGSILTPFLDVIPDLQPVDRVVRRVPVLWDDGHITETLGEPEQPLRVPPVATDSGGEGFDLRPADFLALLE